MLAYGGDFPDDPDNCQVIDRALFTGETPGEEHTVYITLYNTPDSTGTIELQTGTRLSEGWFWETVCIWNPKNFSGEPMFIKPGSVLSIQQVNASILITWIDRLYYAEGLAALYLDYNLESRGFEEFFLD